MDGIFARLRNHIVTGFIFIMPVLIMLAVLMKFWKNLLKVGSGLSKLLRVDTVLGPSGDAVMAVVFFLSICIVAGFLIRISFLRGISERIDRTLSDLIPGYSKVRSETTKKIGAEKAALFDACLVSVQDLWQPGYVVERNPDGTQTVFVPQAPTFTVGQVLVVAPARVRMLDMDSAARHARLKRVGKGLLSSGASKARA
jgi:uncharacterized membrane protein